MDTGLNRPGPVRERAAPPESLDEAQARLRQVTRDAFELLTPHAQDAHYASLDGMLVVEGAMVAVTPTSIGPYAGADQETGVLISAEAGFALNAATLSDTTVLLKQAANLLATFGAALGCNAKGWLVLHRVLDARGLTSATLAAEIVATRRLQRLLNEAPQGSDTKAVPWR